MMMMMKTLFKRTLCRREGCPNNKNLRVRVWRNAKGMLGNDDMTSLKVFQLVLSVSSASCSLRGPELLLPHMPLHFNFWVHFLVMQQFRLCAGVLLCWPRPHDAVRGSVILATRPPPATGWRCEACSLSDFITVAF